MSRLIARGRWDPIKRQIAKAAAFAAGATLMVWGLNLADELIDAIRAGQDVGIVEAALSLAPLVIGALAVFPDVLKPIAYRVIDKFMKDTPGGDD